MALLALAVPRVKAVSEWRPGDITVLTSDHKYTASEEGSDYGDGPTLTIGNLDGTAGTLNVNGEVVIDATAANATVNLESPITFQATQDLSPKLTNKAKAKTSIIYGAIVVNVAGGKKVTINMAYNMKFTGSGTGVGTAIRQYFIIKGAGKCEINMADGTKLSFDGVVDPDGGVTVNDDGSLDPTGFTEVANNGGGADLVLTMEQTDTQISNGQSKLVINRANGDKHTMVYFGPNSRCYCVSDNTKGIKDTTEEFLPGGYSALEIDPSNTGTGRMALVLRGAYDLAATEAYPYGSASYKMTKKYPFNDSAFILAGHYVPDFTTASIAGNIQFNTPAGVKAVFRVTDSKTYTANKAKKSSRTYTPDATKRRGLLVINDVQGHGKLASDPYEDYTKDTSLLSQQWAYSTVDEGLDYTVNTRFGFVVGVNGELQVYDNAFIQYVAGSVNQIDFLSYLDGYTADTTNQFNVYKKRNPSAMIFDGFDKSLYAQDVAPDFEAANPSTMGVNAVRPQVKLFGDGTIYFMNAASSTKGFIYHFFSSSANLDDNELVWENVLPVGEKDASTGLFVKAAYSGIMLANNAHTKGGEGEHVLDIEGYASVTSEKPSVLKDDPYATTVTARTYVTAKDVKAGVLSIDCLPINYKGSEVVYDDTSGEWTAFTRPLLTTETGYVRENSPALFLNDHLDLYAVTLDNRDATKWVDQKPNDAEPVITGGERLYYALEALDANGNPLVTANDSDKDRFRVPQLNSFDSTLKIHDRCALSGVRLTYMDKPVLTGETGEATNHSNDSSIIFCNHGDALDTKYSGFGRKMLFSSTLNKMGIATAVDDTEGSNYVTESTYFNVFKHNMPIARATSAEADTSSTVNVSFKTVNELPAGVTGTNEAAMHQVLFSIPTTDFALCYPSLGWLTTQGDVTTFPFRGEVLPTGDNVFELNGIDYQNATTLKYLKATPASVTIDGQYIAFGGFDSSGNGVAIPVASMENSGVFYVNHGGRITVNAPYQVLFDTFIANKVWGADYDEAGTTRKMSYAGIVDLPHDQVMFSKNYSIHPYCFTKEMFDATYVAHYAETGTDNYARYARVSYDNTTPGAAVGNKSCGEEITLAQFYVDVLAETNFAKSHRPFNKGSVPTRGSSLPVGGGRSVTRSIEAAPAPLSGVFAKNMIFFGPGDTKQLRVAGATPADPFQIEVSGDGVIPDVARLREITSVKSTRDCGVEHFMGEGTSGTVFLEYDGRVGLGSTNYNSHSVDAANKLGKAFVSLCPVGDGTVDVNSNLYIEDSLPFIAAEPFGDGVTHRVTFRSDNKAVEIRVPAHHELDLSQFGKSSGMQQLAFGGKVSLVLEEGATLRLPSKASSKFALYFTDEAKLVFEGQADQTTFNARYSTAAQLDKNTTKILGDGQIWFNKSAKMEIMGATRVAVQTDDRSPSTNVLFSLRKQSGMYIGNTLLAGGAFMVGNYANKTTTTVTHTIACNFTFDGPEARLHINREGYFGFGAGVLNKYGSPNGGALAAENPVTESTTDATTGITTISPVLDGSGNATYIPDHTTAPTAWSTFALANVTTISLIVKGGIVEHANLVNGTDAQASLLAVGPATSYVFKLNSGDKSIIRGGGNMMYVPAIATLAAPIYTNIWDHASAATTGEKYSILGSGSITLGRGGDAYEGGLQKTFTTPLSFFDFIAQQPNDDQQSAKAVVAATMYNNVAGYVALGTKSTTVGTTTTVRGVDGKYRIERIPNPAVASGKVADGLRMGTLDWRKDGAGVEPTVFNAPAVAA